MRAVVLTGDAEITLVERPVPVAPPGGLLLRVDACGICGTDLHAPSMPQMFADDVVLGHEFSGTVVEVGAGANEFAPGEEVVVNPISMSCGKCEACRRGLTNQCLVALTMCSGVARDGGMAEFATVDRRQAHRIPAGVNVRDAAWTEPLGVAVRAVGHGGVTRGSSVAILGAGPIGQLVLQVALDAGAGETLVVESSAFRREVAKHCGASVVASPEQAAEVERVYDVVIDCTGAADAFPTTLALVAPGGRIVMLGSYSAPLSLDTSSTREASIVFSSVYRDELEFARALELLRRGVIDVGALTTGWVPLARHEEAFAALRSPEAAVKVLLDPTLG